MKTKVCFDNSSLGELYKRRGNINLESLSEKFKIYLSTINILELINYENIVKRNELLRFYDKIKYKDYPPLDIPEKLLKKTYLAISQRNKYLPASADGNLGQSLLLYLENPDEIPPTAAQMCKKTFNHINNGIKITSNISRKDSRVKELIKNRHVSESLPVFLNLLFKSDIITTTIEKALSSLGINNAKKGYINMLINEPTPCLFYICAYYGGVYNWGFRREYSPHPNRNDVIQAAYLSICDYFITDDKALKNLLNEVLIFINSYLGIDLKKKILDLDELLRPHSSIIKPNK